MGIKRLSVNVKRFPVSIAVRPRHVTMGDPGLFRERRIIHLPLSAGFRRKRLVHLLSCVFHLRIRYFTTLLSFESPFAIPAASG